MKNWIFKLSLTFYLLNPTAMKKILLFCLIVFLTSCAATTYNPKTGLYSGKVYQHKSVYKQSLVSTY